MKYYIRKIEEITTQEEGVYNEYATISKENDYNTALSKYYKALSDVTSSAAHVYFNIQLVNSHGNVLEDKIIGEYIDPDAPAPKPQYNEITDTDAVAEEGKTYYVLIGGSYLEDSGVQVGDRVYGKYMMIEPEPES